MTTTENKPQILAFGPRGLANISIAMDNNGKSSPAVVDTNDQHDHYDSFDIQNGHVKDYMLDWLAIYVSKTITICLTYGVQLMLIILGSIYVTDCYAAPELPIMAIIVGAGYSVCWVVYRNTETGKLHPDC
ncbi:unnamed protein product [Medioppia subpectinata]|uniref:Uncharacterized protein n=1 Tax=Medioppia subpectinata TaxID=1979941 RepID=A0A7R9L8M8_9ACAR|nr:unnamed protein product [Medioppia subpectinata]CAG2116850.1 unnamed protein product [Medioppia subpectinata]